MKMILHHFAMTALAVTLYGTPLLRAGTLNTLHFDETTAPADGLTVQGISFQFDFGNQPSMAAEYGFAYAFSDLLLQDFVLEGPAQDAGDPARFGVLAITFPTPTKVLNFAIALSTGANDSAALQLYDALGQALTPISIATAYDSVNCDPSLSICLSEAQYTYTGPDAISRAALSFSGANADSFALDNLETELPEPSSLSTLIAGGAMLFGGRRWRKARLARSR